MNKQLIHDYTAGPITRQLFSFSWPFMLSNLLQTGYNIADMIIVGQFVGSDGLSAVANGGEIIHLYLFIALGFSNAGQIIISQFIGLKDRDSVSKTIGCMFSLIMSLAVLMAIVGLFLNNSLMRWLHVPTEAIAQCLDYVNCCTIGYVFICGYNMISAILRGVGDSRRPMMFIGIAAVLNVVLDIILVGCGMGAFGAALATVIAQGVSFIIAIVFLYSHRDSLGFDFKPSSFVFNKRILKMLIQLGIPMVLQGCTVGISTLFVTSLVNPYGVVVSAVNGVGAKLSTATSIVTMALGHASASMIGQNFAAREFDRVKRIISQAYLIGLVFAVILSLILIMWPEEVFALFNDDPAVLKMSHGYVWVAVICFIGAALRAPSAAFCNGLGFSTMNFVMGLVDGVVLRIGLSVLLGTVFGLGVYGYWYGSAIAGTTFFFIVFPYLLSNRWTKRKPPVVSN